ncbi:MAG: nitrate reductase [Planctomycetia bacterium]|nr:nitrate reductase [Planctomycetia bacterium]
MSTVEAENKNGGWALLPVVSAERDVDANRGDGQECPSSNTLLRAFDGPLTRELLLEPGGFGLGRVPAKAKPDATTTSVCGYCSTGCCLTLHLKDGEAVSLSPKTDYSVNLGMACPKGWEALTVLDAPDRATTPLLKDASGKLRPVDWDTALTTFVDRFKRIQDKHGAESVAFISTGQIPTEEMALLGALAKFGMGMKHGDGNTRQCMATSVVAYKQSFGFDAPPYTYADFEESDTIVLVGSNLCLAHPIMWERVMRNRNKPEIIVVDPRRTETAMAGTLHLPLKPKSDMDLFYGIARILIERDWIDREFLDAHTNGFAEFSEFVQTYTLDRVVAATGLSAETIQHFADLIHAGKRVSFWWTMGVNQSYQGVRTAQALINLALMTGNIGKPGTGANSITGQCNAMGSRLYSNTTGLLGGHDFANAAHREKVAKILDIDEARIPREASWAYHEILEGVLRGKIRGLWIVCTNPAHSWINQRLCHEILDRLDFLVVQDMYHSTETAVRADLVLPAAGWGEKEGTFINSERRFGTIKKVRKAPGQALSDFSIFRLVADYWGCGEMFKKWDSPAAVFQIMKQLSAGQPCDITGIADYAMLDECGGIQWPWGKGEGGGRKAEGDTLERRASEWSEVGDREQETGSGEQSAQSVLPDSQPSRERRLFADGRFYHSDERAKFLFESPKPMPEPVSEKYPFILLTGRGTASQWHTQTRTGKSDVLKKLYPENLYVEINPTDARALGVRPNEWVSVESQRGHVRAQAFLTPIVPVGQVFLPMHYSTANQLTDAVFDPYSKQPSYKACAVRVSRVSS